MTQKFEEQVLNKLNELQELLEAIQLDVDDANDKAQQAENWMADDVLKIVKRLVPS